MKKMQEFETQTEQELREVMGGSVIGDAIRKIGGISLMYGINIEDREEIKNPFKPGVMLKYGVYLPDNGQVK